MLKVFRGGAASEPEFLGANAVTGRSETTSLKSLLLLPKDFWDLQGEGGVC